MSNRRPSYSQVVKAFDSVIGINTEAHPGEPPPWSKNCPKCQIVRSAKDVLERAKRKPRKAKSK